MKSFTYVACIAYVHEWNFALQLHESVFVALIQILLCYYNIRHKFCHMNLSHEFVGQYRIDLAIHTFFNDIYYVRR